MLIIAIIFAIYLFIMVAIGLKFYNKSDNLEQYILGGRKLNPWVAAMSAQATDMSGWLLMGLPGLAYIIYSGTSEAIWTIVGLWLGTYFNWLFVAKRLRKYTEISGNALTIPDFFENRFRDKRHIIKSISAVFIVIIFLIYMSSQFVAGGKLFSSLFEIPYMLGVVLCAGIILLYTALGGFTAVCWTDTIQGAIMFFALIIVPIVGVGAIGGWDMVSERLAGMTTESLNFFPMKDGKVNILLLSSCLGWALGYFGHPGVHARFMAINSVDEIQKSRIIAMIWVTITMVAAVFIGMIGRALMPDLADPENVFIYMITKLCNPVIAGILLTAVLAAIMSTASSQLLVSASSISKDLYATLLKKDTEGPRIVWISRITVVVITAIAIVIASNPSSSIFGLVSCAWSGFGAGFGPIILLALFWRRMSRQGAIFGMMAGGIVDVFWYLNSGGIFDVYEIIPGFIAGLMVSIVVSLFTKVEQEILDEFDKVRGLTQ